jgi:hypothetical protein
MSKTVHKFKFIDKVQKQKKALTLFYIGYKDVKLMDM